MPPSSLALSFLNAREIREAMEQKWEKATIQNEVIMCQCNDKGIGYAIMPEFHGL